MLEAVGGSWWVTGLGAGFVGESGGYVELSYCRQRARAGNAGWVMWMLYPLFPLQPGVMDLPRVGPALLSALQRAASLLQLGKHFEKRYALCYVTCPSVSNPAIKSINQSKFPLIK